MEEDFRKDESATFTMEIFLCYAHEDKKYLEELEQHLAPLKRQGLITSWHDRDILAGTLWDQAINAHLNSAQIILLLISASFMSSDYCYSIEMERALERLRRGESLVIPIIVRPVYWQGEPLGKLQALPTDGKPITSWDNQDEAFFDVVEGVRRFIEKTKTPPLPQQDDDSSKRFQNADPLRQESLSEEVSSEVSANEEYRVGDNIDKLKNKVLLKTGLFIPIVILLALTLRFVPFIPRPLCFAAFCHSSQQPVSPQTTQNPKDANDSNLSAMLLRVDSSSFVFSGDPESYSRGGNLPTDIGAVLLTGKTTSSYTIVLEVQNLHHTGNSILIDYVTLQLFPIRYIPRPLTVWTHNMGTTDTTHPYTTRYAPGPSLFATPIQEHVSLAHDEPDQIDIQIHSNVSVYLQFKMAITYHSTGPAQTLTLPWTFQVVFSDASNWQEYTLQRGILARKS